MWNEPSSAAATPNGARAAALELRDIRAGYEKVEVLRGVSLSVPQGAVFALLGPNGAGKSSLIRVAGGRLRPWSGEVVLKGKNMSKEPVHGLALAGVCSIPEGRAIFPNLTVAENLRMWTFGRKGLTWHDVEEQVYSRFPQLGLRRKQLSGRLSGGEQQMLAMSRILSADPEVLLLDEISMGLAPQVVTELYELVQQLASEGIAILVVEQFAKMALRIAARAAILVQGRLQVSGTPSEVEGALADLYMGGHNRGT